MDPRFLARELRASRDHLTRITVDLDGDRLLGPKLAIVNPPLWEMGHVAWFQEYWCLRRREPDRIAEPIIPGADALYDSAKVAHDTRWGLRLPDLSATRSFQEEVLERVARRLEREPENRDLHYYAQLAIYHEDMHAEAFHYTRQTLGYENPHPSEPPAPFQCSSSSGINVGKLERPGRVIGSGPAASRQPPVSMLHGDVELPGGAFMLGATPGDDFVFDNEKWAHEVRVQPFRIARAPVTNAQYSEFVEAGGYSRRELWSDEGWAWRSREGLAAPKYWIKRDDAWTQRKFDRVAALRPDEPVVHVSWHEAQAWCRYANRRLPTEAEWEYAASWDPRAGGKRRYPWGGQLPDAASANLESTGITGVDACPSGDAASGCRQMIGNIWEWTASTFDPYPGFVIDPYKEYSEPWFGTHKVLRGGSFATTRRLIRNSWRNFYTPERYDVFAGFRTCANS